MIPIRYSDWGWLEYVTVLRSARRATDPSARLRALIGGAQRIEQVFLVSSGRSALMLALDAMRRVKPTRRVVVIPSYVCPSVVSAISRLGLESRVAPVSADLNLDPTKLPDSLDDTVLAVVAVHVYGYPVDIPAVEQVVKNRGIFVVDDAAHCLPVQHSSLRAGFGGDAGIFSFALSKSISNGYSGRGGVLTVTNPSLHAAIQRDWATLPEGASSAWDDLLFMASCLGERTFDRLPWRVRSAFLRFVGSRCVDPWQTCRISERDAELAAAQIEGAHEARLQRSTRIQTILDAVPDTDAFWFPHRMQAKQLTRLVICLRESVTQERLRMLGREVGMVIRMGYSNPRAGSMPFGTAFEVPIGTPWSPAALDQLRQALTRLAN